jgi:hypothetical protein
MTDPAEAKMVELDGNLDVERSTALAYRFYDGRSYVWLPKSQCSWTPEPGALDEVEGEVGTMGVPEWLALRAGLI